MSPAGCQPISSPECGIVETQEGTATDEARTCDGTGASSSSAACVGAPRDLTPPGRKHVKSNKRKLPHDSGSVFKLRCMSPKVMESFSDALREPVPAAADKSSFETNEKDMNERKGSCTGRQSRRQSSVTECEDLFAFGPGSPVSGTDTGAGTRSREVYRGLRRSLSQPGQSTKSPTADEDSAPNAKTRQTRGKYKFHKLRRSLSEELISVATDGKKLASDSPEKDYWIDCSTSDSILLSAATGQSTKKVNRPFSPFVNFRTPKSVRRIRHSSDPVPFTPMPNYSDMETPEVVKRVSCF